MNTTFPAWLVAHDAARCAFFASEAARDVKLSEALALAHERNCIPLIDEAA